jgi:hypothetical protein
MRYVGIAGVGRSLTVILLVGVLQVLQAQRPTQSNAAVLTKDDELAAALWRIAVSSNTRIGFESIDHVRYGSSLKDVAPLRSATPADGLNAVIGADGRYEWRRVGDCIVVRPTQAWGDPANRFNQAVRGVRVENAPSGSVLLGIRDFIYTNKFALVDPDVGGVPPSVASFEMEAGSVIDVLNHLMIAADQVLWIASYRSRGHATERWPSWDLTLQLRNAKRVNDFSGSHAGPVRPVGPKA